MLGACGAAGRLCGITHRGVPTQCDAEGGQGVGGRATAPVHVHGQRRGGLQEGKRRVAAKGQSARLGHRGHVVGVGAGGG